MLKLKQKSQIGGKGSMRRKIIKKRTNKITKKEHNFKKWVDKLNKKLLTVNSNNYILLQKHMEELTNKLKLNIKRVDINKKGDFKYSNINKQGTEFIYYNVFYELDNGKKLVKNDLHSFLTKNFKISGIEKFKKYLEDINDLLIEKEYTFDINSTKYNPDDFKRALQKLEIFDINKIHFTTIKNKYEEIKKKYGDNDTIDNYYTLLKNQYEEYLKSF